MKTVKRRFLLALLASLVLHLGVISGPGWPLPDPDETADMPLAARLAMPRPAPAARTAPVARPVPKRRAPAPQPAEPPKLSRGDAPVEAAPPEAPESPPPAQPGEAEAPAEATAAAAASPEAASAPSPKDIALPKFAYLRYDVHWGEGGMIVGQAEQRLHHDGMSYRLASSAETTGLVGLFRPAKISNVSEGEIADGGLRPRWFRVERSSGKNEWLLFDRDAGRVTGSGGRDFALDPEAQDPLSMFVQLALLAIDGPKVSLPVVTGKRIERYDFEALGEEWIETPRGALRTLHLRNRQTDGKEATEIWLGLDHFSLPLKIRHVDRRGDLFEQVAASIEYEEKEAR